MNFVSLHSYLVEMHGIREFGVCWERGNLWRINVQDSQLNTHVLFVDVETREISSECSRYRVIVDHLAPWVVGALLMS